MKLKFLILFPILALFISCAGEENTDNQNPIEGNKVLLLKVDYTTNVFEGGKELAFDDSISDFTIETEYQSPSDFGWIKLNYEQAGAPIFDGGIHWMGLGTINYPTDFVPAANFEFAATADFVSPAGFENIFNPNNQEYDYQVPWGAVQASIKVRQYLQSNPGATAKIFLYTPSVGIGNPAEWDWIIILKN